MWKLHASQVIEKDKQKTQIMKTMLVKYPETSFS